MHPLVKHLPTDLSSSELSRRSGVSREAISSWRRGVHPRRLLHIRDVLQSVGVELDLFKVKGVDPFEPIKRSRAKTADNVDPLIREMFDIAKELEFTNLELSERSGVDRTCIEDWRLGKRAPSLFNFECCLATLGYEMRVVE